MAVARAYVRIKCDRNMSSPHIILLMNAADKRRIWSPHKNCTWSSHTIATYDLHLWSSTWSPTTIDAYDRHTRSSHTIATCDRPVWSPLVDARACRILSSYTNVACYRRLYGLPSMHTKFDSDMIVICCRSIWSSKAIVAPPSHAVVTSDREPLSLHIVAFA